ncbi:hypothetical protein BT96DRAFT_916054 [Gymnopus androsaceus JB14]|uniref:F-box domain-containing protein n=1 Tax=Gymnopus androsaceus JB14 TaxID=1447944 RepID=A0A6A4I860_9AGAR|nr:hypothetical protein BT96DRAFT_916054 [Gymnopus androsaceus JB14]
MPLLEKVDLSLHMTNETPVDEWSSLVQKSGHHDRVLALPVEQLTALELIIFAESVNLDVLCNVLRRCKNLTNLAVSFHIYYSSRSPNNIPVSLPMLTSLNLHCDTRVFKYITAPLLEDLTIVDNYTEYIDTHLFYEDMAGFQTRSSTTLSCLKLIFGLGGSTNAELFTEKLIAILALFPSIGSLSIFGWPNSEDKNRAYYVVANSLFRALTYTKGQSVLLPKLTDFHCGLNLLEEYPSELTPMVFSRASMDVEDGDIWSDEMPGLWSLNLGCIGFADDLRFTRILELPGLTVVYQVG